LASKAAGPSTPTARSRAGVPILTEIGRFDGDLEIVQAWRDGLTPEPALLVSEWADRHRVLGSRDSAEPGPYRTSRTPYLREVMDALSPSHPARRVVFMKSAQVGAPLAIDTPIPTAEGWATMGALIVGDTLFDEHGRPCRVTGVSGRSTRSGLSRRAGRRCSVGSKGADETCAQGGVGVEVRTDGEDGWAGLSAIRVLALHLGAPATPRADSSCLRQRR
jgi:hypothetical protein